ncbi:hypothetical protein [Blastococcus sp. PRF04-17]|uniref:hypothetical protein n=1 Tax=Blastococcus sp. PRF04-17 TaxID=2933797 RepID=UPI001FF3427E|nr:hypothetical protein [Blastococcus sp. PRF04-17]UOY00173.1 hypothetical protein MVA48_14275 [Blastococcus sp. PRF04-17]
MAAAAVDRQRHRLRRLAGSGLRRRRHRITVHHRGRLLRGQRRGNKTLAQEFVANFWGGPDAQEAYFEGAQAVPASIEVLERIRADNPQVAKAADVGAAFGQIMPSIPEMAAIWAPLGQAEAAVIAGADPASTLTAAGTAIRQAIG